MKRIALTAAILALTASVASAAPYQNRTHSAGINSGHHAVAAKHRVAPRATFKKHYVAPRTTFKKHYVAPRNVNRHGINRRVKQQRIAAARTNLARLQWSARADGRVTPRERYRIQVARAHLSRLLRS